MEPPSLGAAIDWMWAVHEALDGWALPRIFQTCQGARRSAWVHKITQAKHGLLALRHYIRSAHLVMPGFDFEAFGEAARMDAPAPGAPCHGRRIRAARHEPQGAAQAGVCPFHQTLRRGNATFHFSPFVPTVGLVWAALSIFVCKHSVQRIDRVWAALGLFGGCNGWTCVGSFKFAWRITTTGSNGCIEFRQLLVCMVASTRSNGWTLCGQVYVCSEVANIWSNSWTMCGQLEVCSRVAGPNVGSFRFV